MESEAFELAFSEAFDGLSSEAPDFVLRRWLRQRLGRAPSGFEVLALRAGLRKRAARRSRWRWWRRVRPPVPPRRRELVDDFLRSWDGQLLLRFVGDMAALLTQLALPDPWEGYDGRHPYAPRLSRRERLREHVRRGGAVPAREQAAAVLAYGEWKLSGEPVAARGALPKCAEFLAPVHAAAINAMTGIAVMGICAQLRQTRAGEVGRRALLGDLSRTGSEAIRLWPGVERFSLEEPRGLWPPVNQAGDADMPIEQHIAKSDLNCSAC